MASRLDAQAIADYRSDGLIFLRGLFDAEEVALLSGAMERDPKIADHAVLRADAEGGATRISLWNRAGDSVYGLAARSRRMVDMAETLIGEPVYHYQSKLTAKDPFVGGAWEWHQDYGYWYHNGCLAPLLASCLIAVDRATKANGCLQVVRASHALGRIDHGKVGDQTGVADQHRLQAILERFELVHCELEPGSAIFFHCNLLHRSDQNKSPDPRWAFIGCYNARRNDPYLDSRHPRYTPLEKWDDARVKEMGWRQAAMGK